ncbi:hypothetical protein Xvie_02810 [Xenorhabdus vietnamensis]|uniref:Uncharacterized protein n=1 Tax=Xenorhabdus vietnamensis TaxID=351656 RepID=A0A1Y2SA82_9GAMM|nr:hypothetical protein Xvie_02810 [Xenorhabdus vietnamensis]
MLKITPIYTCLAKNGLCAPLMSASMLIAISTNAFAITENTKQKSPATGDTLVVIANNNSNNDGQI